MHPAPNVLRRGQPPFVTRSGEWRAGGAGDQCGAVHVRELPARRRAWDGLPGLVGMHQWRRRARDSRRQHGDVLRLLRARSLRGHTRLEVDRWRPALHGAGIPEPALPGRRRSGAGGGDTDLSTAPQANASGIHNVYVASLSLANVTVSTSQDGGKTWSKNVTS